MYCRRLLTVEYYISNMDVLLKGCAVEESNTILSPSLSPSLPRSKFNNGL